MAFDPLAYFYDFQVSDFPQEWLPLTYLYDPDLPLFPVLYFHELDPNLDLNARPGERDRIFGFVHNIAFDRSSGKLTVTAALSKDLRLEVNARFAPIVEAVVRSRLGLQDPVTLGDMAHGFSDELGASNDLIKELWHQIVVSSFGGKLPYGSCWDAVFGLARFIASWNSDGGRKGELIQLHAYVASFGERIPTGGGIHADFYLLPTWREFRDQQNPLALFQKYAALVGPQGATEYFAENYTETVVLGDASYSRFRLGKINELSGTDFRNLNTPALMTLIEHTSQRNKVRTALYNNYSAFNRGPPRAILSLLMHHDLRTGGWDPATISGANCLEQYTMLGSTYQSPKVMQLYAQQCFGAIAVLPIDNWVKTFLDGPLALTASAATFHHDVFRSSAIWGKIERLIWMAAQARKVHSSVAENILWCVRYGGPDKKLRGPNPLSCKVCALHIRQSCPAFKKIKDKLIVFNGDAPIAAGFNISTSAGDNLTAGQVFATCVGKDVYDGYTPKDKPEEFNGFPSGNHLAGAPITVTEFIETY
jgi:hypothetical protein